MLYTAYINKINMFNIYKPFTTNSLGLERFGLLRFYYINFGILKITNCEKVVPIPGTFYLHYGLNDVNQPNVSTVAVIRYFPPHRT